MLPNWLGVGFPRCGTTTVAYILQQHPDIFMPAVKETHFFNTFSKLRGSEASIGGADLAYYEANYFSEWNGERSVGEITPNYMQNSVSTQWLLDRALETIGDNGKFLVFLRQPVRRAFSHHQFLLKSLLTDKRFAEDVLAGESIEADETLFGSLYLRHMRELLKRIDRSRIFITVYEADISQNLPHTLRNMFEFLDVDAGFSGFHPKTHLNRVIAPQVDFFDEPGLAQLSLSGAGERPTEVEVPAGAIVMRTGWYDWDRVLRNPSARTRQSFRKIHEISGERLDENLVQSLTERFFQDEIEQLQDLIDRDLSLWLRPQTSK